MTHLLIDIAQCIISMTFLIDSCVDDLKIVINTIDLMFMNERQNYNIKLNKTKMRISIHVKKFIFRDLFIKVSLFVLNQILSHYLKVINHNMKSCIKQFITTMRLSYAHIMKQRISKTIKILKIKDIHFY